ncbi:hypothetical protein SKAU_G00381080 [Synaphobranchus kaupii]|uniref:Uncharacterized protein n=1 Tax=Synaphobranchus kaupii TaxID=118154 RepID=A0A9Q1EDR5_SYNKA|nr:hypothetical protein SKAU_G00381080 [Synaphobranchus kaupii]
MPPIHNVAILVQSAATGLVRQITNEPMWEKLTTSAPGGDGSAVLLSLLSAKHRGGLQKHCRGLAVIVASVKDAALDRADHRCLGPRGWIATTSDTPPSAREGGAEREGNRTYAGGALEEARSAAAAAAAEMKLGHGRRRVAGAQTLTPEPELSLARRTARLFVFAERPQGRQGARPHVRGSVTLRDSESCATATPPPKSSRPLTCRA